jgi:hypothetical protein
MLKFLLFFISLLPLTSQAIQLIPAEKEKKYKDLLPRIDDMEIQYLLRSDRTIWYDEEAIVPGYQDSMGNPVGMRPNTIDASLINLAVPGGWQRLFERKGRFHFPFATGGADRSTNFEKINFWVPPLGENGHVLPVVYWRTSWTRWFWIFPKGTVLGEVLLIKLPDGDLRIFELRTRKRLIDGWESRLFKPYHTALDLSAQIKDLRPNWQSSGNLQNVITRLESDNTLVKQSLETRFFPGTFQKAEGYVDSLPDLGDLQLVKELLESPSFSEYYNTPWKIQGDKISFGPTTESLASIIPQKYDGGLIPTTKESCDRCHDQAGRGIGDFYPNLILYGELWGEDQTFSWHPFINSMFVDKNGKVVNFNNDNRRLREDFRNAGLVVLYDKSKHPDTLYRELPRGWRFRPVAH